MRLRHALGITAAISFAATIALFVAAELMPRSINYQGFALTAMIVAGHSVIAMGLLVARERGKIPVMMTVGLGLVSIAPLFQFVGVWTPRITNDPFAWVRTAGALGTSWSVLLMVVGVALCQRAPRGLARFVQLATAGGAVLIGVALPIALFVGVYLDFGRNPIFRSLATATILLVAGLLTGLVLGRLRELDETPVSDRPHLGIACPRCGRQQQLAMDGDRCRKCGLWIRVQEP